MAGMVEYGRGERVDAGQGVAERAGEAVLAHLGQHLRDLGALHRALGIVTDAMTPLGRKIGEGEAIGQFRLQPSKPGDLPEE